MKTLNKISIAVFNATGIAINTAGLRIKPLRECSESQSFTFEDEAKAKAFISDIDTYDGLTITQIEGLEGYDLSDGGDGSGGGEGGSEEDKLRESLKSLTVAKLKEKCKELELTGYSNKKEDELIEMIIAAGKSE